MFLWFLVCMGLAVALFVRLTLRLLSFMLMMFCVSLIVLRVLLLVIWVFVFVLGNVRVLFVIVSGLLLLGVCVLEVVNDEG